MDRRSFENENYEYVRVYSFYGRKRYRVPEFKYNPGDKIGPYNVLMLERLDKRNGHWYGKFQCPYCNNTFIAAISKVSTGNTRSCKCFQYKTHTLDITGYRSGKLVAIRPTEKRSGTNIVWQCQCDCGNTTYVASDKIHNNITKSCGCLQKDKTIIKNRYNLKGKRFGKLLVLDLDSVKNGNQIWKCQCDCGNIVYEKTKDLNYGRYSCGCIKSKGENKIIKILIELNINFKTQFSFKKCINPKTQKRMYFDFYLPDYSCCIEYDGEQHFKESDFFKDSLKDIQYRDSIKNEFCKNNNIKLIRIPYTDYDKLNEEYLISLIKNI